MHYSAFHGSPGPLFSQFDPSLGGTQSGYDHAVGVACFTSDMEVACQYAEGDGFVGRWGFSLANPLECEDCERPMGIAPFLEHARSEGYDGIILKNCSLDSVSRGINSDIYYVFDLSSPRLLETIQEGPDAPVVRTRKTPPKKGLGRRR